MGVARRSQAAVGLDVVDELAERAMRSRRRVGLVIGCLQRGEQRVVGSGRIRRDAKESRYHLKLWIGFSDESAAYLPA
jgi:hypothetical protein